jgi:hypothetical protein
VIWPGGEAGHKEKPLGLAFSWPDEKKNDARDYLTVLANTAISEQYGPGHGASGA